MTINSVMHSPVGSIGITLQGSAITNLILAPQQLHTSNKNENVVPVTEALNAYFINPAYIFNLPLHPTGTDFQKRVWRALCDIPAGTTLTYGELAKKLNSSPRAVGQACKRNPIPIIIPCHRVTSANGLGGYMGKTTGAKTDIKQWLLQHERRQAK